MTPVLTIGRRPCKCGCGADLNELGKRPHALFASGACRARHSRETAPPQRTPLKSAQKAHKTRQRRRRAPDRRLPFGRVVAWAEDLLVTTGASRTHARERARTELTQLLPPSARRTP